MAVLKIFCERRSLFMAARREIHVNLAAKNAVIASVHLGVPEERQASFNGYGIREWFSIHESLGGGTPRGFIARKTKAIENQRKDKAQNAGGKNDFVCPDGFLCPERKAAHLARLFESKPVG
jgi:hypothetical protein